MPNLTPNDQIIYREELNPRLPRQIFDAHVHIFGKESFPADFSFPAQNCYHRFGGSFTLSQWRQWISMLLPEQQVSINCFGTPHLQASREVAPTPDQEKVFAMALVAPQDSAELLHQQLCQQQLIGCKPYLNYAAAQLGKPEAEVEVLDMMSAEQLSLLNKLRLAVTLHIPRPERLADPVNQRQMVEICHRYPQVSFIFAHIGRAYYLRNVVGHLQKLAECPNAWLDTAMVNHEQVLKYTFDHFPMERILFGSDAPIALLRGKSVEINHQYAYLMAEDYRIGTAIYDTEKAVDFTTFYYEQLRAILNTTTESNRKLILYENANQLFQSLANAYLEKKII